MSSDQWRTRLAHRRLRPRSHRAHIAVTVAGISGSHIRDMMLAAVERRFGTDRAPHPVEHLSDNASCYTAGETRDFARQLGLVPCFTPVRSPESNGMAETFVETLKRDYVRVTPLPDAPTVLGLVSATFRAGHALARRVQMSAQPKPGCPVKRGALQVLRGQSN